MNPTNRDARRYVFALLGLVGGLLFLVLALNLLLSANTGSKDTAQQASAWQQATRGITYAPPLSQTAPFKTLRLKDRLPEINTVVLGSSTMMGIRAEALPSLMRAYNFSQTGHGLMAAISEAEWLLQHAATVKFVVIPLDWSLGFIYARGVPPATTNLFAETQTSSDNAAEITLGAKLQDALSYPRVASLLRILKDILRAANSYAAFRQYFLQPAGDDYRCVDGSPAKDFDSIFRGSCTGFRFDGSATFANLDRVSENEARSLIARAVVPSSKYATVLTASGGTPNPAMLKRLTELAHGYEKKGGKVLFLLPPLLPGMEQALSNAPATATHLRHTKSLLADWQQREHLSVTDAGKSENYGCMAAEFVDEHHALPMCYAKVFARLQSSLFEQ